MDFSSRADRTISDSLRTLHDFYSIMWITRDVRRDLTVAALAGKPARDEDIGVLRKALDLLTAVPQNDSGAEFSLDSATSIRIDLSYEVTELEKDIVYLTRGEDAFLSYLESVHADFSNQTARAAEYVRSRGIRTLITDRDGTVNNYCGRYLSSIQSVYNAVFLTRCAQRIARKPVILTSAPLSGGGLADISVAPSREFVFAGSKGREYQRPDGTVGALAIEPEQSRKITELNSALETLVARPDYQKFTLIGSGFQKKFGQTTVSRQDINGSIDPRESQQFLDTVANVVSEVDPEGRFFKIEDTGKDIEIMLTVEDAAGGVRDFDKGDGVVFLDKELDLRLHEGHNLICGDTPSDAPMVEAAVRSGGETAAIFVTRDDSLAARVRQTVADAVICTEPDALVVALYQS